MSEPDGYDEIGALIAARAREVRAPDELRVRLARMRARRARRTRLGAAAVTTAALAVLVFSGGAGPSVQEVAAAALAPPTRSAPALDRRDHSLLAIEVDGLAFPNFEPRWGWEATGVREDEVDGRHAVTVIYAKGQRGAHYTIVEGEPLGRPQDARVVRADGTTFAVTREAGAQVVSWELEGHTCVLASRTLDAAALLRMAGWR